MNVKSREGAIIPSSLRWLSFAMLKVLCPILLGAMLIGVSLGALLGLDAISALPSLRAAASRAIMVAKAIFHALQPLGIDSAQALTLSLGLGIFANNALTAMIVLLSPIPILYAKPFSEKYLAKLYYERGIWLFKPVGWRVYRALSTILPLYALCLQFYLIGGAAVLHAHDVGVITFLSIEVAAISSTCTLALLPSLSREPLRDLRYYVRILKLAVPVILACLLIAAIIESHQLLLIR